jgi:hypothetical protein
VFIGCVILESLSDARPLQGLSHFVERVAEMPDDPDAKVWHVRWYQLDQAELASRLEGLASAMKPQWYAHFWQDDDLRVILAGRTFQLSVSDRTTWEPMLSYGDTVGIARNWTERIPTALPEYVANSLRNVKRI